MAEILNCFHYGYDHRHKSKWKISDWYMSKFSQEFFFKPFHFLEWEQIVTPVVLPGQTDPVFV